ncbi:hypothetical protein GCM10009092_32980 [Bowmanella denitrificans]|uniref:TonB-dependent receptor n=1 Tax=Bowmanella denitrificans TaxID=366582 RepID=A0ABN0XJT9_9ALTE
MLKLEPAFKLSAIALTFALAQGAYAQEQVEKIEVVHKRSSILSEITENSEKLIAMPGALGDPLQAVFALPGVVAAGGSMAAPAVRGSSPSDNSFEVDFMPAGYIFHDFGNSIFNKHLLQDFQLYSAAYGPSYANVTGAVFDVTLRNPRHQNVKTIVDMSMFNSGVFVEGAISDNLAFYLSGRKSMLPLFFSKGEELEDEDGEKTGVVINDAPDDNDYQGKLVWEPNGNNQFSLSFTGANDSAAANFNERAELSLKNPEYQGDAIFKRGFNSQSLIWDHFADDYQFKLGVGGLSGDERLEYGKAATGTDGFYQDVKNKQVSLKGRLNYRLNRRHHLVVDAAYYDQQVNVDYDMFLYTCTELDPDCDLNKGERIKDQRKVDFASQMLSVAHIWQLSEALESELGVQWHRNDLTDENFVNPRLALRYQLDDSNRINFKAGRYNRMQDIPYLMEEIGNPQLKSQTSMHTSLGFEQDLADEWSWSLETYYKTMDKLPLALNGYADADKLYSNEVEGRAYGVDLMINKNRTEDWYGWLSVSYGKSERTDLRTDITRDYYADTPLVINAVFNYQINERWNAGFNLTARSGQAYTPIVGVKHNPDFEGRFLPVYGDPFSERFDTYGRLDVRLERKVDFFGLDAKLVMEVMNILGVENISHVDLDYRKVKSTSDLIIKEEEDDFGIRPSVGFSVTF